MKPQAALHLQSQFYIRYTRQAEPGIPGAEAGGVWWWLTLLSLRFTSKDFCRRASSAVRKVAESSMCESLAGPSGNSGADVLVASWISWPP